MTNNISATLVKNGLLNANHNLDAYRMQLNQMNLFPVPDQDTGTNMSRSFAAVSAAIEQMDPDTLIPYDLFSCTADQLLLNARGNSGTMLTLFFQGFTDVLPKTELLTAADLVSAFEMGVEFLYDSVPDPVNGTILSVARQAAKAGRSFLELSDHAGEILNRILKEAHASLRMTPYQNPKLKGSHTWDSGAFGFCLILDGLFAALTGDTNLPEYPDLKVSQTSGIESTGTESTVSQSDNEELLFRYCTEAVISCCENFDQNRLQELLSPMGDCFLCVSSKNIAKIHIHTNQPQQVLEILAQFGSVQSQKIDDMVL